MFFFCHIGWQSVVCASLSCSLCTLHNSWVIFLVCWACCVHVLYFSLRGFTVSFKPAISMSGAASWRLGRHASKPWECVGQVSVSRSDRVSLCRDRSMHTWTHFLPLPSCCSLSTLMLSVITGVLFATEEDPPGSACCYHLCEAAGAMFWPF